MNSFPNFKLLFTLIWLFCNFCWHQDYIWYSIELFTLLSLLQNWISTMMKMYHIRDWAHSAELRPCVCRLYHWQYVGCISRIFDNLELYQTISSSQTIWLSWTFLNRLSTLDFLHFFHISWIWIWNCVPRCKQRNTGVISPPIVASCAKCRPRHTHGAISAVYRRAC